MNMNQSDSYSHGNWTDLAGWSLLELEETASTNSDCLALAEQKSGEFVIWAKHQTAGRGRENRTWFDQPGAALTFSVLMRLEPHESEHLGQFTALGAISLIDLLETQYGLRAWLKWPNDVLLGDKKVCGILTEILWRGSVPTAIVVGMGINLKNSAFSSAGKLRAPATSLEAQGAGNLDARALLEGLLGLIRQRRKTLGGKQFMQAWNARLAFVGKFLEIKQYQGTTQLLCPEFVNPDGSLNARAQDGSQVKLYSSEFSSSSSSSIGTAD